MYTGLLLIMLMLGNVLTVLCKDYYPVSSSLVGPLPRALLAVNRHLTLFYQYLCTHTCEVVIPNVFEVFGFSLEQGVGRCMHATCPSALTPLGCPLEVNVGPTLPTQLIVVIVFSVSGVRRCEGKSLKRGGYLISVGKNTSYRDTVSVFVVR